MSCPEFSIRKQAGSGEVGFGWNWLMRYSDKSTDSLGLKLARLDKVSLVGKLPDEREIKEGF